MIKHAAPFRRRRSKERRFTLRAHLRDHPHRPSATQTESPGGQPISGRMPFDAPATALTLSDDQLESVGGRMGVPTEAPDKVREATCCYLADATPEKASVSVPGRLSPSLAGPVHWEDPTRSKRQPDDE